MVVTRKEKRPLSRLNGTFNDFVIGNNTNVSAKGNKILETQANGCYNNAERIIAAENSARQNQVTENKFNEKSRKAVDDMTLLCLSQVECTTRF